MPADRPARGDSPEIAAEALKTGRLVILPTETVYGLAADASNPQAVARIFEAKGRPRFNPLIAIRPGYWQPAQFASAAATLDQLSGGRVRINIVSGKDDFEAYGDSEGDQAHRYGRTAEFMRLVRRLWTEGDVTHRGQHYSVANSTAEPRITPRGDRLHPPLY